MTALDWIVMGLAAVFGTAGIAVGLATTNTAVAIGLVTLAPVAAFIYQAIRTGEAVAAANRETEASAAMVRETQRDRELAVQPVIASPSNTSDVPGHPPGTRGVTLRNVGPGPAVGFRVVMWDSGDVRWSTDLALLPAGEYYPTPHPGVSGPSGWLPLTGHEGAGAVEPSLVRPEEGLCFYCLDQVGNGLRYPLRTSEPPAIWHRGQPDARRPPWAGALEASLDWHPVAPPPLRPRRFSRRLRAADPPD